MLIGLDFDGTFTRDPEGWISFVQLMKARGHSFVCVTQRPAIGLMASEVVETLSVSDGPIMPTVFAGNEWKRVGAENLGFKIDVWIDDTPSMIEKQILIGG